MKLSLLIFALFAFVAMTVSGKEIDPIVGEKPSNLKAALIFTPPAVKSAAAAATGDEPVIGTVPANMKKSVVSENIFGGAVEFKKGRDVNGCPCKLRVDDNNRYDVKFKPELKPAVASPCPCAQQNVTAPATTPDVTLPVVAQLKPRVRNFNATLNATAPCAKPVVAAAQPIKVTPEYYPSRRAARLAALKAANCTKPVEAAKPATIAPEFYPTRAERRARRKAKQAAKASKVATA